MAYSSKDLSALSYANGFTLWHYRTGDSPSDVGAPGYFDAAHPMLRVGDFMFVNAYAYSATVVITTNAGGHVRTATIGGWITHGEAE